MEPTNRLKITKTGFWSLSNLFKKHNLPSAVFSQFLVDFKVPWERFWEPSGIFSGMGVKLKTVLALTREPDFQGLGVSGSVLFEGLVRASF